LFHLALKNIVTLKSRLGVTQSPEFMHDRYHCNILSRGYLLALIVWVYLPSFLSRVGTLTRDTDIAILSVRLYVRDVQLLDENG